MSTKDTAKKEIKVSALIAVYWGTNANFFKQSMSSLLHQTEELDEIILIVDGSCQAAVQQYVQALDHDKIKAYYLNSNQGLGKALNFGVNKCSHDYILRMDDDDICNEERLKLQKEFFCKFPDVDVLGGHIQEFSSDLANRNGVRVCPLKHNDIAKSKNLRNPMNHVTVMFKKKSVIDAGNYDAKALGFEDYELWMRMISKGYKFANINEILVSVRFDKKQLKQRTGIKAFVNELKLQKVFLTSGYIPYYYFIFNIFIRALPRLLPPHIFGLFIKKAGRTSTF